MKDDYKVEAIINAVHKNRNKLKPLVFKGDSPDSDWVKNNFYAANTGNCTFATYNKSTDELKVGNIKF